MTLDEITVIHRSGKGVVPIPTRRALEMPVVALVTRYDIFARGEPVTLTLDGDEVIYEQRGVTIYGGKRPADTGILLHEIEETARYLSLVR